MAETNPDTPEAGVLSRLRDAGLRPRHALGQNFLHDPRLLDELVSLSGATAADAVFEVGTGPGTLTRHLARVARHVLSVELDPRLASFAGRELAAQENVEIVTGDVLAGKSQLSPAVEARLRDLGPFLWVSNLPYQITTPLILSVLDSGLEWRRAVLTVQLEVAERLIAEPGSPSRGATSLLVEYWAAARIARRIRAGAFWPRPKVESAVLVLEPRIRPCGTVPYRAFRAWVRLLFRSRRKQIGTVLRSSLSPELAGEVVERLGASARARAEALRFEDILEIVREFPPPIIDADREHL